MVYGVAALRRAAGDPSGWIAKPPVTLEAGNYVERQTTARTSHVMDKELKGIR